MDSRMIYAAGNEMINHVKWPNDEHLGWMYCGAGEEVNYEFVLATINKHFIEDSLFVCHTRQNSFEVTKDDVMLKIQDILGYHDFSIWDKDFKKIIDFNKIGVLKCGEYM